MNMLGPTSPLVADLPISQRLIVPCATCRPMSAAEAYWWMVQDGEVLLDMVSLFPEQNGPEGSISPFRADLLSLLKGLRPR